METNYIKTSKTARYLTWGNLSERTKYFWFVLHGSKMLGEQMIYKFKDFDPELHFVIAPEALNRFYANGFGGDVVASWMTSRDRLHEIDDFSEYLTLLYRKYSKEVTQDCQKIVLGFSQGGTTMFRWLHAKSVPLDIIIGYSCWVPEDIDLKQSKTELNKRQLIYTYGIKDQYLSNDRVTALKEIVATNDLNLKIEPYDGDHRVDRKQLKHLYEAYVLK